MNKVTITIDGRVVEAKEGDYILNVARANNIYIPAICYLTRCSPTLACRLCMVDADGKRAYSCNVKVKDGMVVTTTTPEIEEERYAIMQAYDVNHPLQCGVCDKSGECELQDNTLFQGLSKQDWAIKDTNRLATTWGRSKYDAALCIVCERCTTVCKDMIGDAALTTIPRGGDPLSDELKEAMPKDAYTVWNKFNKSLIGLSENGDHCTDCGECAAVCPTGALVFTHFQYTSNAWELTMIPSSCTHCSSACHLWYEVKQTSVDNPTPKIYRVKNDFHFQTLCGAGRFAYDFANESAARDEADLEKAVEAFKTAKTIKFTSQITNEEALILQRLKEKYGYKLINDEALAFKNFMKNFSSTSGSTLYKGSKPSLHASDFAVVLGSRITTDNPVVRYGVANMLNTNKGAAIYFHPVGDPLIESMHKKNVLVVNHAIAREEAVIYWLLEKFADQSKLPADTREYIDSFKKCEIEKQEESITETITKEDGAEEKVVKKIEKEVEVTYSSLCDEFGTYFSSGTRDEIDKLLAKKEKFTLVAGSDLFNHPRAESIAKLLGLLERTSSFEVLIVPDQANTLGVSMICDLDTEAEGKTIGYNTRGDFELLATGKVGENSIDMPAMNQQEGTITNIDKRVVQILPALGYSGYSLGEIASKLGVEVRYTVDFTKELGSIKGFEAKNFDDLTNYFGRDGSENRGYLIKSFEVAASDQVEKIASSEAYKKPVVYKANPIDQFNQFTAKSPITADQPKLLASELFISSNNLTAGERVVVETKRGKRELVVESYKFIDGDFAFVPDFDGDQTLFEDKDYRFAEVTITKGMS